LTNIDEMSNHRLMMATVVGRGRAKAQRLSARSESATKEVELLGPSTPYRSLRLVEGKPKLLHHRLRPLEDRPAISGREPVQEGRCKTKGKIVLLLNPPTRRHGTEVRAQLNSLLIGWSAYFSYGARWSAYRAIDNHVLTRVRKFLGRRHKLRERGIRQFPVKLLNGSTGVHHLRFMHYRAQSRHTAAWRQAPPPSAKTSFMKNRMKQFYASGSVGGERGNILTYRPIGTLV
jgi:hypothetical protein